MIKPAYLTSSILDCFGRDSESSLLFRLVPRLLSSSVVVVDVVVVVVEEEEEVEVEVVGLVGITRMPLRMYPEAPSIDMLGWVRPGNT